MGVTLSCCPCIGNDNKNLLPIQSEKSKTPPKLLKMASKTEKIINVHDSPAKTKKNING